MMNNYYKDCFSKLEKIVSQRKIYGVSESSFKLNNKNSKLNESYSGNNLVKNAKEETKKHPFICAGSASKSHNVGINMQTTMSIAKQFPRKNTAGKDLSSSSHNIFSELKLNESEMSIISQQFNEMQTCPAARSEDQLIIEEDETFNGVSPDPWSVKQADRDADAFVYLPILCDHKKNSCFCPTRSMDSYYKVMTPFVKHSSHKKETDENPFTKSKNVLLYEQQSRRMEELKMTMMAMNKSYKDTTKKYCRLYEQYVRSQDGNILSSLLQLEGELNDLKSNAEEAIELYKQTTAFRKDTNSSDSLLAHIENTSKPKETTTIRLVKNLRRLQQLQDKLKNAHFLQGSGDFAG